MKVFIKKLLTLLLMLLIIYSSCFCFDYFAIGNRYQNSYDAAVVDKAERLLSIDGAKIVLVGNSNVAYGYNSELIERATGMPVVNMGLDRFLGNDFNERLALLNVCPGDIIVVAHSSFSDDGRFPNPLLIWYTIEMHTELWPALRLRDIPSLLAAYPQYFYNAFSLWLKGEVSDNGEGSYHSRSSFNSYGDIASRPELERPFRFYEGAVEPPEINDTCIKRLNALNAYLNDRGASLVVAAYPIADGEYTPERSVYEDFERELRQRLDCDVISDYSDYFFPYELFYDAPAHMSSYGAELRSEQLSKELVAWMQTRRGEV